MKTQNYIDTHLSAIKGLRINSNSDELNKLYISKNEITLYKLEVNIQTLKDELNETLLSNQYELILNGHFDKIREFISIYVSMYENLDLKDRTSLKCYSEFLDFAEWFITNFYYNVVNTNTTRNYDSFRRYYEVLFENITDYGNINLRLLEGKNHYIRIIVELLFNKAVLEIKDKISQDSKMITLELIKKDIDNLICLHNEIIQEHGLNHANNLKKLQLFEDANLFFYQFKEWFEKEFSRFNPIEAEVEVENIKALPEIDLKTKLEQVRLLNDLGIIDFLINKYPSTLKGNNNQVADLISKILKDKQKTIQPIVNALINDNAGKNYPKETLNTKAIIDRLNSNESF